MPQIGWSELLVIAVIAILVIGPKDLPVIAKKVGGWIRTIKGYAGQFQNSLENIEDIETVEIEKPERKKTTSKNQKKTKLDS
jgi:sec-independent protein translocase protein TatB